MGTAMSSWETTSGGVRMAATMKMTSTAYLRALRMRWAVTTPMRERKKVKMGISKMSPKASRSFITKSR